MPAGPAARSDQELRSALLVERWPGLRREHKDAWQALARKWGGETIVWMGSFGQLLSGLSCEWMCDASSVRRRLVRLQQFRLLVIRAEPDRLRLRLIFPRRLPGPAPRAMKVVGRADPQMGLFVDRRRADLRVAGAQPHAVADSGATASGFGCAQPHAVADSGATASGFGCAQPKAVAPLSMEQPPAAVLPMEPPTLNLDLDLEKKERPIDRSIESLSLLWKKILGLRLEDVARQEVRTLAREISNKLQRELRRHGLEESALWYERNRRLEVAVAVISLTVGDRGRQWLDAALDSTKDHAKKNPYGFFRKCVTNSLSELDDGLKVDPRILLEKIIRTLPLPPDWCKPKGPADGKPA